MKSAPNGRAFFLGLTKKSPGRRAPGGLLARNKSAAYSTTTFNVFDRPFASEMFT